MNSVVRTVPSDLGLCRCGFGGWAQYMTVRLFFPRLFYSSGGCTFVWSTGKNIDEIYGLDGLVVDIHRFG